MYCNYLLFMVGLKRGKMGTHIYRFNIAGQKDLWYGIVDQVRCHST